MVSFSLLITLVWACIEEGGWSCFEVALEFEVEGRSKNER